MPADVVDRLREAQSRLPPQLDAWLELSALLQDDTYRTATREYLRDTYASEIGRRMAAPKIRSFIAGIGEGLRPKLAAAHTTGDRRTAHPRARTRGLPSIRGRYLDLVAVITGMPGPEASVRGELDPADFGEWFSRAIRAAGAW